MPSLYNEDGQPHLHLLPRIAKTRWPSGRAIINQQVIRYFSYLDIHDPLPHFLLAWFRNGRTITAATESNSIVCIPLGRKNVYRIKGSYPNTVIIVVKPFQVLKNLSPLRTRFTQSKFFTFAFTDKRILLHFHLPRQFFNFVHRVSQFYPPHAVISK